ncbi:UDP-glucuronosyltransferase 1A1-like isoform X2 [Entelurus aequoreus]|nr:UDP-glucuronosyltransferase 1A1-like isoform X2 [Entelurus aequoreus]XP_061926256.1 UDP-glucuronosyltransferase 1A1-like isoform X2 [Entelurus aequoreus]XP_061926257.1 UDP-glucuronosyltransferase 1A1-like isoform X2 [Entelurus aequoreus]
MKPSGPVADKSTLLHGTCVLLLLNMTGAADQTSGSTRNNRAGHTASSYLGKLLVVPMDGSHWIGIKAVAQEMGRRGHQVTVVIPEVSMQLGPGEHYDTLTYPVPYDKASVDSVLSGNKDMLLKSTQPFLERMQKKFAQMGRVIELIHTVSESLLFNDSLIAHLDQQGFDAVLTDPMLPTGALIARKLGIPNINILRGIPCFLDMQSAGCPSPPSYVPRFFTGLTDKMDFKQRVLNTVVSALEPLLCRVVYWRFDRIASRFLNKDVGVAEVLADSAIWLHRIDFTLEYPRPLMPNMVPVGGINCDVRNPLPADLDPWVSGERGFVVFTLGTALTEMPEEITMVFLEAFRQIPQKVIWRYSGSVPGDIPENVKMMKWVPQNDLLAHRGVRAFITHAGSHGLFEGICHAVPMVMVPISGDQPDNAQRLASKGAGLVLDITSITTEDLLQALNEVINDTRHKETMKRLSALHKDRPVEPVDLSVFWTEFVMRHKGADHLKAAVTGLNWFQYFCLDVMALLAAVLLLCTLLTLKCIKFCWRKVSRKRKRD